MREYDNYYFDSDGVLVNFAEEKKALLRFSIEVNFFYNLKRRKENFEIMKLLLKLGKNVYILTASPNAQADQDKMRCYEEEIPELPKENIIICRLGENKAKYIKDKENSVLIDDYTSNLLKVQKYGVGVIKYLNGYDNPIGKHTKHNIDTITSLSELFIKTKILV